MTDSLSTRCRHFASDESGSSEVEYLLLTGAIVLPLSELLSSLLITSFTVWFGRIGWWINLPFP